MSKGFFVTGTDTEIGKSWCSAAIIWKLRQQGHCVNAMKPVASGCLEHAEGLRNDDALLLQQLSSQPIPYNVVNPYPFKPAIAPHIAAKQAGICIDLAVIRQNYERLSANADYTVVEGVGGWLAPLNPHQTVADLATSLALPVILVVGMRLGCINHALLTARQIQQNGNQLAGWIANPIDPTMHELQGNIDTLINMIDGPHLGTTPHIERLDYRQLAQAINI